MSVGQRPSLFFLLLHFSDKFQAIDSVSADYDKIIEFFEDLDSYLSRLKVLEVDVMDMPTIPELKTVLIEVLVSVLDLCGIATKYIKIKRIGESNLHHCLT